MLSQLVLGLPCRPQQLERRLVKEQEGVVRCPKTNTDDMVGFRAPPVDIEKDETYMCEL